ncbi:MAG TPA: alpha/beta hydrolase, partial [Smithella sp.]|nr:alpha/beta hydrolase [Smithella sp.]
MTQTERILDIPSLNHHDIGGAHLPYLYYEGETPQILFAHATGFLPWLWHPILEELTPPRRQAWAPYICNYRDCDPESGGLSWDVIARDLISFCSVQNISDNLAVGHSMGATVVTI